MGGEANRIGASIPPRPPPLHQPLLDKTLDQLGDAGSVDAGRRHDGHLVDALVLGDRCQHHELPRRQSGAHQAPEDGVGDPACAMQQMNRRSGSAPGMINWHSQLPFSLAGQTGAVG